MFRNVLSAAVLSVLAGSAVAQESKADARIDSVPITYVGTNGRIGVGIDRDGRVQGEALGIWGNDGRRAFLSEAYFGEGDAAGVKLGYHWLWGGATREDSILKPESITVTKLFAAWDRNRFGDGKATLGLGFEREGGELAFYYSRGLTGARLVHRETASDVVTVTGEQDGRPYRQEITTDTLTETFEQAYRHGIGLRASRFFEGPLLRLRGGLDYERGSEMLARDHASQTGIALGAEKMFSGSGHSLALELGYHRKRGPYDRPAFGGRRDFGSAAVIWRYEFGDSFRPVQPYREMEVAASIPAQPQAVRNEVRISSEELFEFDRADLTPAAQTQLSDLLPALTERRVGKVRIVGHTCDLGSDAYNQDLSERRAAAVGEWLRAHGVPADAIEASGRGENEPAQPNSDEANRKLNRRIELEFMTVEQTIQQAPSSAKQWKREPVPVPPAWIERALRNLPAHKRAVDTYRAQRVTETVREGPRSFINRPPVATDDAANVVENGTVLIAVLANDRDPDGDTLSVRSATDPGHGQATVNADGSIAYTPDPDYFGEDRFDYTIVDGQGGSATATVTVIVAEGPNRPPVAVDDAAATNQGVSVDIIVVANDSDPDGDGLLVTSITNPANGSVLNGDDRARYTPNDGFTGQDSFQYTITDRRGGTATATVTVTVASNQAPNAVDDAYVTFQNVPAAIPVLDNDSDPDGDVLSVQSATDGLHGTTAMQPDGKVLYSPASDFVGEDRFTYTATDGRGRTASATVVVTVLPPPT